MVTGEVVGVVLPLAVRMIGWRGQHASAAAAGTVVMRIHIVHAHHHRLGLAPIGQPMPGEYDGAVPGIQLRAMIADLKTQRESERIAQPVDCFGQIRIADHGITVARGIERFVNIGAPLFMNLTAIFCA